MPQRELFNVLDELIGPLSAHITQLLTQPVPGTDDSAAQTKRAYLTLLTNIMSSDLHDIFISDRKFMCYWCGSVLKFVQATKLHLNPC
jgi:exportin-T